MKRFEGKVAMVTGGNSGIGLAAAKAFAREGAQVAVTGRDEQTLKNAEKEIGSSALTIRADAARIADLDAAMAKVRDRFKRIDALFVNAGIGKFVPIAEVTEAVFDEIVTINLKGAFFTVQKALPLMARGSAVVFKRFDQRPHRSAWHDSVWSYEGRSRQYGQNDVGRSC